MPEDKQQLLKEEASKALSAFDALMRGAKPLGGITPACCGCERYSLQFTGAERDQVAEHLLNLLAHIHNAS